MKRARFVPFALFTIGEWTPLAAPSSKKKAVALAKAWFGSQTVVSVRVDRVAA